MSVRNKLLKRVIYTGAILLTLVQSYANGLLVSSIFLSSILAVWSIIKPLPLLVTQRMWLVYLLSGIPTGLIIFIYLMADLVKARSKKHNKQGNGNQ